ncbi:cation transporter [bacterium]|nr:cation transporter [bacterium]
MTNDHPAARYYRRALCLGIFTVAYNIAEGLASIAFGIRDEALTLFGFGIDSFIECLSGLGIVAMVLRIRKNPDTSRGHFEKTALRITGTSFYLLAVGLFFTAAYHVYSGHKPDAAWSGIMISTISIMVMSALVTAKRKVGRVLGSAPILADANCTLVCIYMSVVLLSASGLYAVTGIGYVDSLGALGLVYYTVKEGKEAFEKAGGVESFGCR